MKDYYYEINFSKKTDYFFLETIKDYINNDDVNNIIKIYYDLITTKIVFKDYRQINVMFTKKRLCLIWTNDTEYNENNKFMLEYFIKICKKLLHCQIIKKYF